MEDAHGGQSPPQRLTKSMAFTLGALVRSFRRGGALVDKCRSRIGGAKVKEEVTPSSCLVNRRRF